MHTYTHTHTQTHKAEREGVEGGRDKRRPSFPKNLLRRKLK
jgi:hypothetical protein